MLGKIFAQYLYCIEYEYTIHHEEQSLCIDGSINKKSHEKEKIKYCKKADYNQKWRLSVDSNGFQTFKSKATEQCLDSSFDGKVYTHVCDGTAKQKWI